MQRWAELCTPLRGCAPLLRGCALLCTTLHGCAPPAGLGTVPHAVRGWGVSSWTPRGGGTHADNEKPMLPPFPAAMQMVIFGMGCFWGAEWLFWKILGVFSTQLGYTGGFTPNPTYDVRTGLTGHAEVVRVIFNPQRISYEGLLKVFWENHNPTQGMQQQEDVGTQYGPAIYTLHPTQQAAAFRSRAAYQQELRRQRRGDITAAIEPAGDFFYAEDGHQQDLHKVPGASCDPKGTGVACSLAPRGAP
ncbi:peptide methionine sulfoxide reductase MsrA 1-like [Chlamydotis macqueenii]